MAEGLLRDRLQRRGVPATVHSAGLLDAGVPASAYGVEVLRARGIDLAAHRSTTMDPDALLEADLVLGMARLHVREAVVLRPQIWPKAFTLKELVRRGEAIGPRAAAQSLEAWLAAAHEGRAHTDLLGEGDHDDIFDPIGSPKPVYEKTATEIEDLVDRLVGLAFANASTTTGARP